ncbi:MAG: aromatic amino acid lyase, partial [Desulfobacterales bacterium]|nr:aromatic amino acid lyase [Desulfobacterales bacterium]
MDTVLLRNDGLTVEDLVAIARGGAPVRFTTEAHGRLQKSSDLISKWVAEEKKVYGVTTGFGN